MPDDSPADRLAVPVKETDHMRGPADAAMTLVEYGDYECDYCANVQPVVEAFVRAHPVRFVFRNFPLNSVHPHASVAAQAAEAAAAQGKFWPMHDLLYKNQAKLAGLDLSALALTAGLELYRFEADMAAERFADRVLSDFRGGRLSGVTGTPTFFINEIRYRGPLTLEALAAALR